MLLFRRVASLSILALLLVCAPAWAGGDDLYYYSDTGARIGLSITGGSGGQLTVQRAAQGDEGPMTLSSQFVVRLDEGANIGQLAARWNAQVTGALPFDRNLVILEAASAQDALRIANGAFERGEVRQVFNQFVADRLVRQLPNDPSFGNQWHLNNTGQSGSLVGHDVRVNPVWNFTNNTGLGTGVTIGVVDTRVQSNHTDLVANLRTDLSLWLAGTAGSHGTSVAGVSAGVGNNGIGISGVAPRSWIAGISLLNQSGTDANEALALSHEFNRMVGNQFDGVHIYNNSWGPADNATRDGPGPLVFQAFQNAATTGRNGLGNLYVWAGGNGGASSNGYLGDNVNYDGYANSRFIVAVGSSTNNGVRSSYSERGACLFVNAPSNGGSLGITTTTSGGGYTSGFGGTSSASPAAAGVMALMLEANPTLSWRDVKHILARHSRRTDLGNSSWAQNSAGFWHSDLYGFGTVDAQAAVTAATGWSNVAAEAVSTQSAVVNQVIASGTGTILAPVYGAAVSRSFNVTDALTVEHVEVVFSASGGSEGDLEIMLTSPSGTQSFLAYPHGHTADYVNWTFMTVKNWGESSVGAWTLRVRDGRSANSSSWTSWTLRVFGTANAIPEPGAGLVALLVGICLTGRRHRVV